MLGVHSIGGFVLTVPAVEAAQEFHGQFGLPVDAVDQYWKPKPP